MTQTAKRRTMYMHTLDGKPASTAWYMGGHALFMATPRTRIRLETSLRRLRMTQRFCREHAAAIGLDDYTVKSRYGHRLVEVPS